jgi:hypothetical protein
MRNVNRKTRFLMFLACVVSVGAAHTHKPSCAAAEEFAALKKVYFSSIGVSSERSEAKIDKRTLTLMGPDNPNQPTAWQGPLVIGEGGSGKSCEARVSLITDVYSASRGEMVVIVSYSGSQNYLHFIDTSNCSDRYPTIKVFTEGISVVDNRITILPACECPAKDTACDCSAGQVLSLSNQGQPMNLENESKALTKRILGVEFQGRHKVLNPKTSSASLVRD